MEVDVYLYPGYVSLAFFREKSPNLCAFLSEQGVKLVIRRWGNGKVASIPTDGAVIVRASSMLSCTLPNLAKCCALNGHLIVFDNALVLPDGTLNAEQLIPATEAFLERLRETCAT